METTVKVFSGDVEVDQFVGSDELAQKFADQYQDLGYKVRVES